MMRSIGGSSSALNERVRSRSGKGSGGVGGSSIGNTSITTSVLILLSCLGTVYVGGRLWQDARLQKELVQARRSLLGKTESKAVSVEESMRKIELSELRKREALMQVELAEAKSKGFVSISGAAEKWQSTTSPSSTASSSSSSIFRTSLLGLNTSSSSGALVTRGQKGAGAAAPFLAVLGINTRFADRALRDAIRSSWLPTGVSALKKLEDEQGLVFRFLVGHSPNKGDSSDRAIAEESALHKDFLILEDHEEDDHDMSRKLKSFYANAVRLWDALFYVKMDDDVYINIPGLVKLLEEYKTQPRVYLGCMKSTEVVVDSTSRWYEPEFLKFGDGKMYNRHAAGPLHVVTKELALYFAINRALLHDFKHEDVSLGTWMLGLDATFEDNRLLCCASAPEDECVKKRESGKPCAAVYDWHCGGLCEAEKRMSQIHKQCQGAGGARVLVTSG